MKDTKEIYEDIFDAFNALDEVKTEDIVESFGKEEGTPIDNEVALIHHMLDGLLCRIEQLGAIE